MKEINFINTQDIKKNNQLKKYINMSIIAAIITFIILTMVTVKQKNKLNTIKENIKKHETNNLQIKISADKSNVLNTLDTPATQETTSEPIDKKTKLKNEKTDLKKQLLEINNLKKTPKKETNILLNIYKTISKQVNIQAITITKNNFIISAESTDDKIANKTTKQLSRLQYIKTAQLTSIQKNNNKFVFQIKGEIKQ